MVRRFFAFVVILIAVLVVPAAILLSGLGTTLLNEDYVTKKIVPLSYEVTGEWFMQSLAENRGLKEVPGNWKEQFKDLVTLSEYQELANILVHSFFDSIKTPMGGQLSIDLTPIRTKFKGFVADKMNALPECHSEDIPDQFDETSLWLRCIPAGAPSDVSNGIERGIPPRLVIGDSEVHNDFVYWLSTLHGIQSVLPYIAFAILFILMGIVALLTRATTKSMLRWVSSGLFSLVASLGLFAYSISALFTKFTEAGELSSLQASALRLFFNPPIIHIVWWVAVMSFVAITLLVLSFIDKKATSQ